MKVKGQEKDLYRAVDCTGQTIDFLLTAQRDQAAAQRFFRRVFRSLAHPTPRVLHVDKNPADPAAVAALKKQGTLPRRGRLRPCKYFNHVIEQDHRVSKQRVWRAKGDKAFARARRTLAEMETMPMSRQGGVRRGAKNDVVAEAKVVAKLFGLAAERSLALSPVTRFLAIPL
jgi:transposase, IS6 family